MRRKPLRWKILLYSSVPLTTLIVATLVFVNYQAERFVDERIVGDLEQGYEQIVAAETERLDRLALTAGLLASFPQLKGMSQ